MLPFIDRLSSQQLSALRLALAITFSITVGFTIGFTGAFIWPVFVSVMLAAGGPPMPILKGLTFLFMVGTLLLLGQTLAELFLPFPVLCSLLILSCLFIALYASLSGAPLLLVIIMLLGILMFPLLGMSSIAIMQDLVIGLFVSIVLAVFTCWVAHGLIPDPRLSLNEPPKPEPPPKAERARQAMIRTLLVLPIFLVFYGLELTSDLLVLVFVALLIQMPTAEIGIKGGTGMLIANLVGGIVGVLIYQALSIAPSLIILGTCVFAATLLLGQRIFSDHPTAALYGTGLNTMIVLLGSTTGAFGDDASSSLATRLFQIMAAVFYIIAALTFASSWLSSKSDKAPI